MKFLEAIETDSKVDFGEIWMWIKDTFFNTVKVPCM